ncbi:unnamed protein product, partial [Discosporangium mesarthrocarpum]
QERVRALVDQAEAEQRAQVQNIKEDQLRHLEVQRKDLRHRQLRGRQERFGGIDHNTGIYAGFGKSCR